MSYKRGNTGYIALITTLILAAIIISIGITTSLLSINQAQSSLAGIKNEILLNNTESCIEDILLTLNNTGLLPSFVTIPEGECFIIVVERDRSIWKFNATMALAPYSKTIEVQAERNMSMVISSWKEIDAITPTPTPGGPPPTHTPTPTLTPTPTPDPC